MHLILQLKNQLIKSNLLVMTHHKGRLELTPQLLKSEAALVEQAEMILKELGEQGDELAPFRLGQLFFEEVTLSFYQTRFSEPEIVSCYQNFHHFV